LAFLKFGLVFHPFGLLFHPFGHFFADLGYILHIMAHFSLLLANVSYETREMAGSRRRWPITDGSRPSHMCGSLLMLAGVVAAQIKNDHVYRGLERRRLID